MARFFPFFASFKRKCKLVLAHPVRICAAAGLDICRIRTYIYDFFQLNGIHILQKQQQQLSLFSAKVEQKRNSRRTELFFARFIFATNPTYSLRTKKREKEREIREERERKEDQEREREKKEDQEREKEKKEKNEKEERERERERKEKARKKKEEGSIDRSKERGRSISPNGVGGKNVIIAQFSPLFRK